MGAEECKLFAREGAKVAIADVREEDGRRVEAEIAEAGGEAVFVALDVSQENQWVRSIGEVVARFGKLDILVNNAGIFRTEGVEQTSGELWDLVMDINGKGVFLGTKAAIPEMRRAGGGSIVNISSVAGLVGGDGSAAYRASKGAVRLFTKSTAIQYAAAGIRANSVHPGVIETSMTTPNLLATEVRREHSAARHPLGRVGQPEDVAYGVVFLASDESSFMTGSELVIDGGLTAQ